MNYKLKIDENSQRSSTVSSKAYGYPTYERNPTARIYYCKRGKKSIL